MLQNLMRKMKKDNKGFTLVELMIVVVIIGILIAIAIPVYNSIQKSAEIKACAANRRTIRSQMEVYKADTGAAVSDFTGFIGNTDYFAATPACPTSGTYALTASGAVTCTSTDHN